MSQVSIQNVSSTLDVCCKCFIGTLHMLQWLHTYVASVCFKCFICFRRMLQEVLSRCKCFMSRRRQSMQAKAVPVCAIQMLQKYIWMSHMLQWLYTYVSSIYSKCFIYFRRILQVLLSRCCICCSGYTYIYSKRMFETFHLLRMFETFHLLQTYVI
jgi:hypothetical protein